MLRVGDVDLSRDDFHGSEMIPGRVSHAHTGHSLAVTPSGLQRAGQR